MERLLFATFLDPDGDDVVWETRIDPERESAAVWARVRVLKDDGAVPWTLELVGNDGSTWRGSGLPPGVPTWTGRVSGPSATLRVRADEIPAGLSLVVDRVGYLFRKAGLESLLDPNDPKIEPFARYATDGAIGPTGPAVAKLETWFDPFAGWSPELVAAVGIDREASMLIPCTGFLIGRSSLLTAGHCLPTTLAEGSTCPNTTALFGFDADDARAEPVACKRVVARPKGVDLAIVELAESPSSASVLEPRGAAVETDDALFVVHHPDGESKKVTVERCSVRCVGWSAGCPDRIRVARHDFLHDCDTKGGSSGSPVFRLVEKAGSEPEVALVGLHHSGFAVNRRGAALPGVVKLNRALDLWRARDALPGSGSEDP